MTTDAIAAFRARLGHELTRLDRTECARERSPNIYRLGHYLTAADDVATALHAGKTPAVAFSQCFTPTRGLHGIAKRLGIPLDVQRGEWVR